MTFQNVALHLIARHLKRESVTDDMLAPETVKLLQAHHWPGNVRETANVLEHACILSDGRTIQPEDLPRSITRGLPISNIATPTGMPVTGHAAHAVPALSQMTVSDDQEPKTLRQMEEEMILRVLDKHQGDKPLAARELGIALKTLYNRLSQMGPHRYAG